jgi:hypothetical protein
VFLRRRIGLVAMAAPLTLAAVAASGPVASAAPARAVAIVRCGGVRQARPAGLVLACADANWGLSHLRWGRWGGNRATALGSAFANTCTPSCVDGTFVHYRVRVAASGLVWRGRRARYTRLVVRAQGRPPAGFPRVARFRLTRLGPLFVGSGS